MFGEVDQLESFANAAKRRFGDRFRFARERNDAAVVIRVALAVEDVDAFDGLHRGDERVNLRGVAAFGKIRHAFNQTFHSKVASLL